MTNPIPLRLELIPLRVACGIGVADSLVALATAVLVRPDAASIVVGIGWVLAWTAALLTAEPLARAVGRRPWALVGVAVLAMAPALLDGGYPGNLATQPMWIALVAAAAAGWPVTVATGVALCAAKIGVFLATGTPAGVLLPGGAKATEATTAAFAPLAVAGLGLVLVHAARRVLAALAGAVEEGAANTAPAAAVPVHGAGVADTAVAVAAPPAPPLSPAERAVVVLLAEGLTPKQIAHARGVSLATVRTQIKRAKRATRARTLDELVAATWRSG